MSWTCLETCKVKVTKQNSIRLDELERNFKSDKTVLDFRRIDILMYQGSGSGLEICWREKHTLLFKAIGDNLQLHTLSKTGILNMLVK